MGMFAKTICEWLKKLCYYKYTVYVRTLSFIREIFTEFLSQQVYTEVYKRSGKKPEEATFQIPYPPPSQVYLLQL